MEQAREVCAAGRGRLALADVQLEAPICRPPKILAVGLNYRDHAVESNLAVPDTFPPVFTKFRTALSGPITTVALPPGGHVDWEVELVVVIGRRAEGVAAADAWSHVAGLTAGQDISERITQLAGPAPQFSHGKSFPGFAPIGPWVVTVDEFDDPDDIELQCAIGEEILQKGRTSGFLFGVPALIEGLSRVTPYCLATSSSVALLPGLALDVTRSGFSSRATYSSAMSPASGSCVRRSSRPNGATARETPVSGRSPHGPARRRAGHRAVVVKTRLH